MKLLLPLDFSIFFLLYLQKLLTYTSVYDIIIHRKEEMTLNKDYSAQKKHLRTHYVRFPLDLRPEVLEAFRNACKKNATTPTTEIKRFISSYCEEAREK